MIISVSHLCGWILVLVTSLKCTLAYEEVLPRHIWTTANTRMKMFLLTSAVCQWRILLFFSHSHCMFALDQYWSMLINDTCTLQALRWIHTYVCLCLHREVGLTHASANQVGGRVYSARIRPWLDLAVQEYAVIAVFYHPISFLLKVCDVSLTNEPVLLNIGDATSIHVTIG